MDCLSAFFADAVIGTVLLILLYLFILYKQGKCYLIMKEIMKLRLWPAVLTVFATLIFSSLATAQVALPDYSTWKMESVSVPAVHGGKQVYLKIDSYYQNGGIEQLINIYHDENDKPWFLFYASLQHTPDHQNEKIQYNCFEHQGGNWVHVRGFTDHDDVITEITDFLKSRYDLEFKSEI